MEIAEFVDTRRRRYTAQLLQDFERNLERQLDLSVPEIAEAVEVHKREVRRKLGAIAADFMDVLPSTDLHINGAAVALTDRLAPEGPVR